jgi:hypothetical protein
MLDYRMATELERKTLSIMMSSVFCEIRLLCRQGNETQAADLADVFHNKSQTVLTDSRPECGLP